jgi:outer membrane protein assembly factor BamB
LTLAGGQIVYATQAGAIVAVDARTGEPTWAVRYPSRGPVTREFEPSPRDLAPCVYADGRIYAAPLDVDRLLCIDARSGRVAWEAADVEIVHLLGTAHERIYATTPTGLQAWKLSSGRAEWVQPSEGRLPSLGRGLIAGGWLFWPTQDPNLPFRTVTLKRGMPQRGAGPPSVIPGPDYYDPTMFGKDMIPAGNMAFGQGCLAIAGVHELVVFTPPRLAPVAPGDAKLQARLDSQYQKARALAHVGEIAAAKTAYGELLTVTKTAPHANDWRKLIETRLNVLDPSRVAKAPADAKVTRVQDSADKKQVFHGPNLPLVRAWEQSDGRVWPIDGAERFLCWQPGRITCRKEADGRALWQHKLDFEPTWVKRWRDRVLVIGADGVQAHRIDDGQWLWSFAAPSRGWPQASVLAGIPKIEQHAAGIQHAEIWGDTLLLLDDSRTFLRLRLEDGTVAWQYASPAAPLRPLDAAAFSPHWSRVGERLLVQSVTGQPHVLNTSLTPFGTKARPWLQSPCLADGRVVIAGERGTIAAYDVGDFAMPAWTYRANFATSLTGDLCRLFTQDTVLLAQVPRNRGAEWIRLNPATGKLVWSITPPDEPAATTVCIGDTAFYRVIANQLIARSLNDGTLLWSQSLPVHAEQWALRYTPESLAVYPASAAKDADFAVSLVDPFDGRWQQRLLIPDVRGGGQVLWTSSGAVVSAGGRIFGFRPLGME